MVRTNLEKYLNLASSLEKHLNLILTLKSTWKQRTTLEKYLNLAKLISSNDYQSNNLDKKYLEPSVNELRRVFSFCSGL